MSRHGTLTLIVLLVVESLVGLAALGHRTLPFAIGAGIGLSLLIWVFSQNFGALYTGEATDPNIAPLIVLMAIALLRTPGTLDSKSAERASAVERSASYAAQVGPPAASSEALSARIRAAAWASRVRRRGEPV